MQGEQEAEMMIIEAYAALLLAFLSTERLVFEFLVLFSSFLILHLIYIVTSAINSADVREAIASCLPNHNLQALVPVLERFVVGYQIWCM